MDFRCYARALLLARLAAAFLRLCRHFATVFVLLTFIVFMLGDVLPSAAVRRLGSAASDQALLEKTRRELGLTGNIAQRYGLWLCSAARLQFGHSLYGGFDVNTILLDAFQVSMPLCCMGIAAAFFGILLGMFYAPGPSCLAARTFRGATIAGLSPSYLLSVGAYAACSMVPGRFNLLQESSRMYFVASCLIMINPFAVAFLSTSGIAIHTSHENFVLVYRGFGLGPSRIRRHLIRNILLVLRPQLGRIVLATISACVFTEEVFGIRGIGSVFVAALRSNDTPVLMGWIVVVGAVVSVCVAIERV